MRSVICLYLAFNRDFEYHRGWSHISYALMSLGATEEETLLIFSHLVQNILPVSGSLVDLLIINRVFLRLQTTILLELELSLNFMY